jgi:hypothetical protein
MLPQPRLFYPHRHSGLYTCTPLQRPAARYPLLQHPPGSIACSTKAALHHLVLLLSMFTVLKWDY